MADLTDEPGATASVESGDDAGTVVVRITGELDMSSAAAVRDVIDPVLAAGPTRLVFDVAALEFLDSSGLAVLLQAAERAGDIVLRNPTGIVRRVVEATGLESTLPVEDA